MKKYIVFDRNDCYVGCIWEEDGLRVEKDIAKDGTLISVSLYVNNKLVHMINCCGGRVEEYIKLDNGDYKEVRA